MDFLPTKLSGKPRTLCTFGYICVTKSTSHVTDSIWDAYCDGFSTVSSSRHLNGFSIQIDGPVKILGNIMRTNCKLLFRSFWLIILYSQVHYKKSFPGSHFCLNFITFIRLMQCFKFSCTPRVFSHAALLWLRTSQGGRLGSRINLHFINQKLLQNGNYLNSYSQRNFHEFFFFCPSSWNYLYLVISKLLKNILFSKITSNIRGLEFQPSMIIHTNLFT